MCSLSRHLQIEYLILLHIHVVQLELQVAELKKKNRKPSDLIFASS